MSSSISNLQTLNNTHPSAATVAQSLSGARANATTGSTASTANSANGSDISAGDFLTLLVTEMKNQDPTQPTDPNQYIQQLVGVNSLQELISINSTLGNALGSSSTTTSPDVQSVGGVTAS